MPWWDQSDDEVDSQYAGTQTVWGQSQSTNASTSSAISQNVPTRWDQAAAQLRPSTQGPAPRPTSNQRPATSSSNQRPSNNVVQGPQTQAQATGWGAVVNYLRPALNLPRPSTNRVTYDVKPQAVQYARPQVNTGAYSVQPGQQMQSPTNRLSAVALASRGSSVPRDEAYYTSGEAQPATPNERRMGVNQNVRQQHLLKASYGVTQPKDDAYYIETDPKKQALYTWNDMLNDNLKAFTGASLERVKEDWSDVWQAGKGNYFNPAAEAQAQAKEIDEAGRLNQEIMDRAYQLRQTYYQTQQQRALTVDGQALDFSDPANQVALQPFVEQAQKEVGRTLIVPEAGLISQGLSIAGGVLGNVGQVPVLGNVSNLVGNTLGTLGETFNQVRTAINVPVQVGGEDILSPADRLMYGVNLLANPAVAANTPPILPILGSEGDPEFVTVGEIVSAAVETIGHPGEWWSNPGAWSYARNPVTMLAQSWADNVQETIDVVYSVGPAVGQPIAPTDNRTLRAIATATLDLSNNASKGNYIEAVLNKPQRLADLKQQQLAAMQVVHNDMLPQDIRDANAKVAAELQMQITGLENADAQTLAYMYMQPLRDAVLATLLDPTMLYDVARWAGVPLPNFSPKGRRLKQVLDAVDATDDAVATKVAGAFARSGDSGVAKRALWEGGLARTEYEMTRAQTFLAHSLQQITDKTDIPVILQRLVDNPAEFFTRGIPVAALKGQTIRSLEDAAGFVEMVSVQAQRADFDQLANSLKALSGQFANLPSLKSASATIPDVIQDIKNAIEIQSAYRNKVSPFSRAIPVGATQARVYTGANAVGDLTYMTEYLDGEGKVLARYAAPTERLAQMEVEMATKGIKAGKYAQTNHIVNMTHNIRRGFSIPALVLNAAGTITNAVGAHIHAWTTGSDTFTPISVVVDRVKTAFPVAPFEYLQEGSVSRMFDGAGRLNAGPFQLSSKLLKKLRELRGGQTELPLGSLGSLGFGENANKAKIWYKESSLGMNMQVDGAWRRVLEPALIEAGVPEPAVRALRSQLERLSKTWDVQDFLDTTLQYATGQAKHLDIAALGKEYETVLTPAVHTALDKLAQAAKTPQEIVTGGQRILDAEIARWGNMVGYQSKVATNPVTVQGMVADLIQDVQTSIEGLARHGVQTGNEGANIQAKIAGLRAQIQRAYSVAAQARNPEALEQFRVYFENLEIGKRSLQEQTDRLFREAKVLGSPEAWVSAFQAKLLYHQEFADDAVRWGEETLQRVLTGETAPPPAAAQVVEDVAELVQPAARVVESLPNRIAAVANPLPTGQRIEFVDFAKNFTDEEWPRVYEELRKLQNDGRVVLIPLSGEPGRGGAVSQAAWKYARPVLGGETPPQIDWDNLPDYRMAFYRVDDLPIEQLPLQAAPVAQAATQAPIAPTAKQAQPILAQQRPAQAGAFTPQKVWPVGKGWVRGRDDLMGFYGWKLHIGSDDLVALDNYLRNAGVDYKIGQSGGQVGKDATVYIGSRDDTLAFARKMEADIGSIINPPVGEVLKDDIPFAGNLWGRFDGARGDKSLHQYGSQGVPYLYDDAMQVVGGSIPSDLARKRSTAELTARFGEYFTGASSAASSAAPATIQAAATVPVATRTIGARPIDEAISAQWRRFSDATLSQVERDRASKLVSTYIDMKGKGIEYVDESASGKPKFYTAREWAAIAPPTAPAVQSSALPQTSASSVPAVAPSVLSPDISQVDPAPFLTRRGTFGAGMEEAQHFFRRASEIYTDVFKQAAEQVGDLRAIDIFLQTQGDITRRTSEIQALIDEARQVYLATRGADRKAKAWKQAADIFYNLKAQENYDLGVWVNAKRKAAIAYLTNMPEPVTFTHSQYGEVTVVGIKNGQVAIQLPTGQMTTIAEDALSPTVLKAAQERLARIANTAADPIKAVEVQGIPPKFAAQVDKEAATLYDVLVESRQKMYTAHPTVTDSTADTIMLLRSLRDKLETAAQGVFAATPGKLNPAQTAAFIDGANYVKAKFRKWTEAASIYGNEMASFHMIDTNRRYRADETASLVMPYHVWKTRMGRNLAEMIATQPIIRHAFDIEDALFEQMNGDQAKKSMELDIGGIPVKIWAGLGRYLTSVGDWNGDPTYYEQQRLDGPLGGLYAVEQAVGSGVYPWFGMADNFLRTQTGQEPIENGGARYAQGIFTLAWRLAELSGTNVFKLLDPLGMKGIMQGMTKRDQSEVVRVLQAGVNRGAMTNIEAYYAMGLLDNYVSGKPLPAQMTADQKVAAEKLLNDTIVYLGRKGVTDYFATIGTSLLGLGTVREQVPGAADLSAAQALRADLEYPANEAGGAWAQRAVMTENPGIAVGFARYNIGDPTKESPALIARATEFQTQADAIYAEMSNAVTKYILSQAGTVASYKAVKALKQPFYAQIDALKEQYADIQDREFSPPDLQKKNPYERALYELEQVLRNSGKDAPAAPLDTMTPEQQVDGWAAIEKFNAAQLDTIERQIEQLSLSYEGPGDPPAQTAWMAELAKLTNNQYASELLRKYDKLKYADRVEKQWDQYGAFEKELDATVYAQQQENVRQRLGESAVRDYQVYQRVKDENKAQYKDEHPAVALAMIAAYNPEAWDTAQQLFGQDAWTTYRAYKDKQPKWPGDTASDAEKAAYNQAVAALRKQYPQAVELAFWVDGRYRWWYGSGTEQVMSEVPGQVRQGKFGEDYEKAVSLFGDNIFEIVAAYPIGGTGKQKAQYYDRYPQYAAFQAWRQQYSDIEDVKSIADLQTLALAQLPAAQPEVNASIPPWWTQFAAVTEGGVSRPLGSGREPINETPAQAQQRLIQEAKFKAAQQLEAAKTKAIADKGKAAIIDSSSYQERMDDEYQKRYGRRAGYTRRYYGGRRGGGGGTRRTSYGGGGGGGGAGYYPAGGTDPSLNPALWSQPKRNITPLNVGGDINPSLWGSLLEKLRRPGR